MLHIILDPRKQKQIGHKLTIFYSVSDIQIKENISFLRLAKYYHSIMSSAVSRPGLWYLSWPLGKKNWIKIRCYAITFRKLLEMKMSIWKNYAFSCKIILCKNL